MLQDLTVPHHADIVDGGVRTHVEYEFYCEKNSAPIYAETSGLFTFDSFEAGGKTHCDQNTAFGWVDYAAHQSKPYHDMCRVDTKDYATASQYLLPLGTRLTVGFLLWAYHILNPSADVD
ncbi:MAG: hypothetical protein P1Q69_01915 [Candidatus Thorarchaeota archaeon]|nr:hypothetical protein [Candidatus Thorarchaeota archaeon]